MPKPGSSPLEMLGGASKAPLLLSAVLLAGCGSLPSQNGFSHWGDGAPTQHIDLAAIPNAQPRVVPYSRYGNPDSYVVNGRRYRVLKSSADYRQQGIASWYGTKFHGHKTSSGEPYDMYAMTAAHKTLPLPTWVEVTNRNNGRKVIVKVNDRGPFIGNRILDLSYAAAAKLGVTATGTAPVTIRAIDPARYLAQKKQPPKKQPSAPEQIASAGKSTAPGPGRARLLPAATNIPAAVVPAAATVTKVNASAKPASMPVEGFYLQVAAFSDRHNAEQLRQKLLALKPAAIQIDSPTTSGNRYYRVRIGPLSSLSEAGRLAAKVSSLGLGEPKLLLD